MPIVILHLLVVAWVLLTPLFSLPPLSCPSLSLSLPVRSRALLSLDVPQDNLQSTACNWFRYLFGRDSYPARPRPSAPYGPWPQPSAEPSRLSHKTTPTSDRLPLVCSTANTSSDDDSLASHGQCKLLPQPVAT